MSSRWLTCPQCQYQFEHTVGTPRICPRCGYGRGQQRRPHARKTAQLPPENPYPPSPALVAHARRAKRQRRPFSSYSRPVQIISILTTVGIIALCCFCGFSFANSFNKMSTQSTSAPVSQGQNLQATSTPTSVSATTPPAPAVTNTPVTCAHEAVNGNPWCFTFFNTNKLIYDPPTGFCGVFSCISSFADGSGYVVECNDGEYSKSGGKTGVCSGSHNGFQRNLYAP